MINCSVQIRLPTLREICSRANVILQPKVLTAKLSVTLTIYHRICLCDVMTYALSYIKLCIYNGRRGSSIIQEHLCYILVCHIMVYQVVKVQLLVDFFFHYRAKRMQFPLVCIIKLHHVTFPCEITVLTQSEKSPARPMLFYSTNY